MRRILIVFNLLVVVLFVSIWGVLIFSQKRFASSGFEPVRGIKREFIHFSSRFPYVFFRGKTLMGFAISRKDTTSCAGLWKFSITNRSVQYFLLPDSLRFKKVISLLPLRSGFYQLLTQMTDSTYSFFYLDSTLILVKKIKLATPILSVTNYKNKLWIFTQGEKEIGIKALYFNADTFFTKTYKLPSFFKFISRLAGVIVDGKKIKFLYYTTHYNKDGTWIRYDTSKMAYFMVYDERHTYPLNSFMIRFPLHRVLRQLDKQQFGLLPHQFFDVQWNFRKDLLFQKRNPFFSAMPLMIIQDTSLNSTTALTKNKNNLFILHYLDAQRNYYALFFKKTQENKLYLYSHEKLNSFMFLENDIPRLYLPVAKDTFLLLTESMNYAFFNSQREPIKYRSFLGRVHYRIIQRFPGKIYLLETQIPEKRALELFALLYGLPILIFIFLFGFYLHDALQPDSFFKESKKIPFYIRFFVATFIYFIIFLWKITEFASLFNLIYG